MPVHTVEPGKCKIIITSWKPIDIALGVSDIEVFPLCLTNGITLLINNRIHLKAFLGNDFNKCFVTSSNISNNGLALSANYNYELGTFVDEIHLNEKIYFDTIIEESTQVTKIYYDHIKNKIENIELEKYIPEYLKINDILSSKEFLITSLPMSDNVDILYNIYRDNNNYEDDIIRSAKHDVRLYNIPPDKSKTDFFSILQVNFFRHLFIKKLLVFNGSGKYFGELSKWVHSNCTTVPTPRRFEIKEALQRIFHFIVKLSNGEYIVEIPKKHSEMLKKVTG